MNLTLKDIFMSLWKSIYLIITASLIGTIIFWSFTYFMVDPTYEATAKLYVYNEKDNESYITQSDLTVSKSLVDTYLIIVKSSPVLEETAERLRLRYPDIDAKYIDKMVTGNAINETEAFYISATDSNRQKATDVVNTIIDIVPEEIIRIVKAASVEVIEEAQLPAENDYEWPIVRNSFVGFLIGFVLSVLYILVANSLDTTVYGRNEIISNFKIPIIGAIPSQFTTGKKKRKKIFSKESAMDTDGVNQSFVINKDTSFAVSEAYRMARTNIFYLPIEHSCRKIAITSAIAAEGKSYCSINMAKSLAQAGKRVLLVDADMRKPRVARYLNIERAEGLSEFLAGITDRLNIIHSDELEADVILSGNSSSSAAELLATARIDTLFEKVNNDYDYIIIDTPPVNVVTDATVLSNKIDGYLISVRAGASDVDEIKRMVKSLEQVEAKIMGIVVSNIDPKSEMYGKYSRYGKYYKFYGGYKKYSYSNYYKYKDGYYTDYNKDGADSPEKNEIK